MRNGAARFEDRLDNLKHSVRHLVDSGGEHARSGGRLIKSHPLIAIAIAAGVGFGVYMLMRRR